MSAFLTPRGRTGQLLHAGQRGTFRLFLSREILAETTAVLPRPRIMTRYQRPPDAVREFVAGLARSAHLVRDLPRLHAVPLDPKDDMVVGTAVKAKADYLVTGDRKHLLALGDYESIRIVTPREFRELLVSG